MKNLWQKKSKKILQKISIFILAVLIFNLSSSVVVFANELNEATSTSITETLTEPENESENPPKGEVNETDSLISDEVFEGDKKDSNENATSTNKKDSEDNKSPATSTPSELEKTETEAETVSTSTSTSTEDEGIKAENSELDGETGQDLSFGIITSGNATAFTSLTNLINNLSLNSNVLTGAENVYAHQNNIDLRPAFFQVFNDFDSSNSTAPCVGERCYHDNLDDQIDRLAEQIELSISFLSEAFVQNQLTLSADTGNNSLAGDGFIVCGDATVFADVVNVVNNIAINSNVLFQSIYKQGDLDFLVLPTANFFQEKLIQNPYFSELLFNNDNTVILEDNFEVSATTGNNSIGASGEISTGDALAKIFIRNLLNRTLVNSLSFSIEIQAPNLTDTEIGILGNLPNNMHLINTINGVKLTYEPDDSLFLSNTFSAEQIDKLTANINTDTTIKNFINLYANSGLNDIAGNGIISCGNAVAIGNIVNYANNIVVGSQLVDILIRANNLEYLAFGQPDLQIGLSAKFTEDDFIKNGSEITYLFTIFNGGDRNAENVAIKNTFPINSLEFITSDFISEKTSDQDLWFIGDLAAGEIKEFKITAKTNPKFAPHYKTALPLTAEVYKQDLPEDDFNLGDNKDSLTLFVGEKNLIPATIKTPVDFKLTKTADKNIAKSGEVVTYTVEIDNRGGDIFNTVLVDTMVDKNGNILSEQTWPLETIVAGELITINYSITIPQNAKNDIYTNYAYVTGVRSDNQYISAMPFESEETSFTLVVKGINVDDEPKGEVLGITDTLTCEPYLTSYLKINDKNDPNEVMRLQFFLKNFVDKDLEITSVFDLATEKAVKEFQESYAADILAPWNMDRSSGHVYYTTQKKINEIMCGNTKSFPLSEEQLNEIDDFKKNKDKIPDHELIFAANDPKIILAENTEIQPKVIKKFTFSNPSSDNKPYFFYRPLEIIISLLKKETKTTFKF